MRRHFLPPEQRIVYPGRSAKRLGISLFAAVAARGCERRQKSIARLPCARVFQKNAAMTK